MNFAGAVCICCDWSLNCFACANKTEEKSVLTSAVASIPGIILLMFFRLIIDDKNVNL